MRRAIATLLLGLAAAGLTVRFTFRDSLDALAPFFYALPLPVIGGLFLGGGIFARSPARLLALFAGVATLGGWFARDYGFAAPKPGAWKFITWNMQNATHPSPDLLHLVRGEQPDFMALIEAGRLTPEIAAAYERALPGYRVLSLGGDRGCLLRGEVAGVDEMVLPGRSRVVTVRARVHGDGVRVIIVDLDSGVFRSRRADFEWITAMARGGPRTVVLGDFNTPLDSAHFDGLRGNFREATEGPHAGFRETWPYEAPFLSLDQIWVSRDLEPRFARRTFTLASDHAPVVATFDPRGG